VRTIAGLPGNQKSSSKKPARCKKGFVKRHGKCVKKKKKGKRSHKRRGARR
jgi:hypothetical protein